jgi:thioredoxin-related protein
MKETLLQILLFQLSIGVCFAQSECDKILAQEIILNSSDKSELDILNNTFTKLTDCGLEQVDADFFANGPILATLLVTLINDNNGTITYQNLLDKIIEFKQTPEYEKTIELFKVSNELSERKADIKNWLKDRKLFEKLELPSDLLDEFYIFLKNNSDSKLTYKEAFEIFTSQRKQFNPPLTFDDSEEYSELFKNPGNLYFEDLLKRSKDLEKPILLYFTGYACINARKIEGNLLNQIEISSLLKNDFIFVNLFVDDKRLLPKEEWFEDEKSGKIIKTIGAKFSKLQIEMFQNNSQPYFVIIDQNGIKIKEQGYTRDLNTFKEFLTTTE